jgi:DnaK suppressor protein
MNVNSAQIRERLEQRRSELVHRSQRVERDLTRAGGPISADFSEQAVEVENDEALQAIGRAASVEIAEIDEALQRLSQGEYGTCKRCGQPIEARRLAAIPQSTSCAGCRP